MSPADILFLTILCESRNTERVSQNEVDSESDSEEEFYSPSGSPTHSIDIPNASSVTTGDIFSHHVLLTGKDSSSKCVPHIIHICTISEGVQLIYMLETGNAAVSSSLYEAFLHLHVIQNVQMQRDVDTLKPAFENLDLAVKKLCDSLKKVKNNAIDGSYRQLLKRWDFIRKKYLDYFKNSVDESLLRAETATLNLLENLKELLSLTAFDKAVIKPTQKHVQNVANIVTEKLSNFNNFLKVKAIRNFSLGSYPFFNAYAHTTVYKYVLHTKRWPAIGK